MIAKRLSTLLFFLFHAEHANGARYDAYTSANLHSYMKSALPGDEIFLSPGIYVGNFYSFAHGTPSHKITIRSADPTNKAVIRGLNFANGEALYIAGNHWVVQDLILTNALQGIVFDNAMEGAIINCDVHDIGEEGIHIRDGSSYVLIQGNTIQNTGLSGPGFGEGIYIGSDKGVHNIFDPSVAFVTIQGNLIGPNVRAEGIDVKEGTHDVSEHVNIVPVLTTNVSFEVRTQPSAQITIQNNTFNAAGLSGVNSADSFIDLKGIRSIVRCNTFNQNGATLLTRGINIIDRDVENSSYDHVIMGNIFNLDTSTVSMVQANKNTENVYVQSNTRNPRSGANYGGFVNQSGLPSWYIDGGVARRCDAFTVVKVQNVSTTCATVVWSSMPGSKAYNIEYKQAVNTTWTTLAGISGFGLTLNGLLPGTLYDVRLQAECSTSLSSCYSLNVQFQTKSVSTPNPTLIPLQPPTSKRPTLGPTLRPTTPLPTLSPTGNPMHSPMPAVVVRSSQMIVGNGTFNRADWKDLTTNGYILYNYNDQASHPSTLYARLKPFGIVYFQASGTGPSGVNKVRYFARGMTPGAIRVRVNSTYADVIMFQEWRSYSLAFPVSVDGSSVNAVRFENLGSTPVSFLLDEVSFAA